MWPTYFVVNVVQAAPDPDDDSELFELLQVLLGEADSVPHEGADGLVEHLLVDLRGALGVAEGHGGHVLENGHLHGAVAAVEQRHQRPRVGRTVWDGASDRSPVYTRPLDR